MAGAAANGGFVGARSCRQCHPGEYAAFTRSGHAHTLRPAGKTALARQLDGRSLPDPEAPDVSWRYSVDDGRLLVTRRQSGRTDRRVIDYALGSGTRATTFLSLISHGESSPGALEHRLTHFTREDELRVTPGHRRPGPQAVRDPFGLNLPPAVTLDCLACHATRTSSRGEKRVDVAELIPNVSCERCHGPGLKHVEAARRGAGPGALRMPFGGDEAGADAEIRLCGRCHRLPDMLRPDMIRPDNPVVARFAPVGLLQSACFTRGDGSLRCTTCHDPHARASTDSAAYDARCLACHEARPRASCTGPPRSGCVECHMPKRDAGHGLDFSDHWIRRPGPTSR